ncbi:exopolyphosphatase [Mucilaginibacter sp. UR6-11]|uniref:Ppx/GppA phosphatase family protein n=1 Tax=Mucilaginibacter sp. UR6-11 TaxID=1435644 RepID=UPI001E2C0EE5|nr:exopolyphosphatase [Mucilaginibacter sp. UR6-11]MCC8427027.1 exopolyphosphatase [Mucilaginibacter sp. UR6-11]
MSKRIAVMDLGTNTFHLLIAEGNATDYKAIVHEHDSVKLGEGGINKGVIQPAAYARGIATMQKFKDNITKNGVESVIAVATSAIRNASNGQQFIDEIAEKTGICIELIDGEQEAAYIYQGVKLAGGLSDQTSLIMDIGGGSVEFIVGNNHSMLWKQSFEIGAARLMDKFHRTDPIPADAIGALNSYLEEQLISLIAVTKKYPVSKLIGSSGAFETFAEVIELQKGNTFSLDIKNYDFDFGELIAVTNNLIASSHAERENTKGIIPIRIDMIVVASLITRFIIHRLDISDVSMSTYSLKEGVLAELMN